VSERVIAYNSQNDGLGTFTHSVSSSNTNIDNLHAKKAPGANNGTIVFYTTFSTCNGNGLKFGRKTISIDGATNAVVLSSEETCVDNTGEQEGALLIRETDDIPLALWVRAKSLYVGANSATDGSGTWTEYAVRTVSGQSLTGSHNSFAALSNGGYGVYYFQRIIQEQTITQTWEYSYTTDTSGTAGWVHQTIYTTRSNRRGVLGVDGVGRVFIATTMGQSPLGYAQIQIMRGVDASGTSFTPVGIITFDSSCTLAGVNRRHMVLLSDNIPGFLATCQNQRLFFIKSLTPAAGEQWSVQPIVFNDISFNADDPTADTSIHMTTGSATPHVVYRKKSENNVVFVQSKMSTYF
jgi:hypothetical protein